jgi:hypothetical protein
VLEVVNSGLEPRQSVYNNRRGEGESKDAGSDFRARIAPAPEAGAPPPLPAIELHISFPDEEVELLATKDFADLPGFRDMFQGGITLHVPKAVLGECFEMDTAGPFEQRHHDDTPVKYALRRTFVAGCMERGIGSILYVPSGGNARWEKAYLDWSELITTGTS